MRLIIESGILGVRINLGFRVRVKVISHELGFGLNWG